MAHKILVDGTNFGITGGKNLIDGTEYSISGGKTLVDGTRYDISFVLYEGAVDVTISGTGNSSYCFVSVGGKNYTSAVSTGTNTGAVIELYVGGSMSWIKIDGELVSHTAYTRYQWTVPAGVKSVAINLGTATISGSTHGFIEVITS